MRHPVELNQISVGKQSAAAPSGTGNNPGVKVQAAAAPSTAGGRKLVFAQIVGKVHLLHCRFLVPDNTQKILTEI